MKLKALAVSVGLSPLFFAPTVTASFYDEVDGRFDMGHHIAENATGFLPIPILITEPAIGYGGGVAGLFLHETEEEKKIRKEAALKAVDGGARLMPAAITVAGAAGTENGTWYAFAGHQHSWLKDKIRYMGGAGGGVANLDIYKRITLPGMNLPGFADIPPIDETLAFGTKTQGIAMMQQLQFRVASTPLMLGIKQVASQSKMETESDVLNTILERTIGTESVNSGLGVLLDYDTRNNYFYPSAGYKVNAEYMVYDEALGSDYDYSKFELDGQFYFPIADDWTLGLAGNYKKFDSDDVVAQPTLKPYVSLRGISAYRFQGDEIQVVQSQLTYDIDSRWKVSGFYGVGRALDDGEQNHQELAAGYGAGFRYQIARRYGLHIGADIAKSKEESAFYISIGSGF